MVVVVVVVAGHGEHQPGRIQVHQDSGQIRPHPPNWG